MNILPLAPFIFSIVLEKRRLMEDGGKMSLVVHSYCPRQDNGRKWQAAIEAVYEIKRTYNCCCSRNGIIITTHHCA